MNVLVQISYISNENKVLQRGSFPLRGKTKEQIAFTWWKQIRREMPFGGELEKILVDGDDVTEKVKEMDEAPLQD
jgi:hypothetical protein